jgi:hypothetical protein
MGTKEKKRKGYLPSSLLCVYDVCWHVQSSLTFNDLVSSIKTNSLTAASAVEIEERDIPGIPAGPHTGIVNMQSGHLRPIFSK